jgi:small GTP-binding protein
MSLNNTPSANRLHIALFGRRNSGKSSLINALTGQDTALVSDIPGTTTDPVSKAMELHGIGPCVIIDTPGFDDEGTLGEMRIERTLKAIERTDIALLFCEENDLRIETEWKKQLEAKNIPVILCFQLLLPFRSKEYPRYPYIKQSGYPKGYTKHFR